MTLKLTYTLIQDGRRGVPWECLLARYIEAAYKADPDLFPHPVYVVYVKDYVLYIQVRRVEKGHSRSKALWVRYTHNFGRWADRFDRLTKQAFMAQYGGKELKVTIKPIKERRPPRIAGEDVQVTEHTRALPGQGQQINVPNEEPAAREQRPQPQRLDGAERRAKRAGLPVGRRAIPYEVMADYARHI